MLDSDAPMGATSESPEASPAPRRRRRAASRPAGPPAAVVPPTDPVAVDPQVGEPAVDTQPAEPPASPVIEEPTVEAEVVEPVASEVDEKTQQDAEAALGVIPDPDAEAAAEEKPEPQAVVEEKPKRSRSGRGTRRRGRRRADAEEAEGDIASEVSASLAELTASLGKGELTASLSKTEPTEPVLETADISAVLNDLAAAIGAEGISAVTQDDSPEDIEDTDTLQEAPPEDSDTPEGSDTAEDSDAPEDAEDGDDTRRKRRRRRGGRRRRRGSEDESDSNDDEGADTADDAPDGDEADATAETDDTESEESAATSSRRRRRRRRRGEDTGSADEDGVDVVIKVREPRRSKSAQDEITSIEGSTRMEAKRQRRREGRAAGRRRAPILSEAEFLARRESLDRQMLIRQAEDYTQIAVLEDGILVEHYVDRDSSASLIGNVYLGRVQNVLPSMEAAFIDIGRGRNAVIYAGEIDWDTYGVTGEDRRIEKVLKSGQSILVQVTKDPIGAKGARLTGHISIPGRYVVYCPGGQLSGISRKLPDAERARLKTILDAAVAGKASVIVRTAAEGASAEELERDVHRLQAQWEIIEKKVKAGSAPQQLYTEPDLTVRIVRDLFTEDFTALIVEGNGQGEDVADTIEGYVTHVAPHLGERLRRWDREAEGDLFEKFRVHEQVAKALERKVHLPSGGSLIIDRTEAMTVVDVNTGKFTGTSGNLEATVTSNNLEAAEEIVRQLRLRDIGGIIVIDFIDMVLPANRELLLRRLVECLGRDRTRHQVAEVTSLGLVQMTRKRIGTGLAEAFTISCETCKGRGYHVHDAPVASQAPADGGDRDHGRRGGKSRSGGRSRRSEKSNNVSSDT